MDPLILIVNFWGVILLRYRISNQSPLKTFLSREFPYRTCSSFKTNYVFAPLLWKNGSRLCYCQKPSCSSMLLKKKKEKALQMQSTGQSFIGSSQKLRATRYEKVRGRSHNLHQESILKICLSHCMIEFSLFLGITLPLR